jgi:hypothetical protein
MNRLRMALLAAICLIAPPATLWSAPAPAAQSGLEQLPASAQMVFYLRGVQGTRDRFVAMKQNALPEVLKKIQANMDAFLNDGFDGRKIRGLPKDGPIFLVLTELPDPTAPVDIPKLAIVLAVTDYKEFRDNILTADERTKLMDKGDGIEATTIKGERAPTFFLERKGYAIVTPNEDVAKSFTKKQTGLHTRISKEQAAKLLAADGAMYWNMEAIYKQYGDQIKAGKEELKKGIGIIEQAGDESQKKIVEVFAKAIDPVFQAIEDLRSGLLTIQFRPGGLALHIQGEMRDNTPTASLLEDSRPVAFKELDRMPAGSAFYSAMKTSTALYKGLGSMIVSNPFGQFGKDVKGVAEAMEGLGKAGPSVRLDGFSFPMKGLQVYQYDEPAKAVEAHVKLFQALAHADPKELGLKEKPNLKMDAEKFGDFKLHSVEIALDYDRLAEKVNQGGEEFKKAYVQYMKKMMGEKVTTWFGTDGKSVVQVSASDWETARKILDDFSIGKNSNGDDKAFVEARKGLPAQTSFMGMFDALGIFGNVFDVLKPLLPPGQIPANVTGKGARAYIGLAVTLQPKRGSFDLFITAGAAKEIYKSLVQPFVGE